MSRKAVRGAPDRGLRAAFDADLRAAVEALAGAGGRPDAAVHEARRALKRARAVLRLLRPAIGDRAYVGANARLRDAARPLSALRDSRVLRDTLHALRERTDPEAAGAARLERALARQHEAAEASLRAAPGELRACLAAIRSVRRSAQRWKLDASHAVQLADGVRRIYRRGRRTLQKADSRPTVASLHELRKQAKYLANALRAVASRPPRFVRDVIRAARDLGDVLGEEHDLAVLAARARRGGRNPGSDASPLARKIARRRARLQAEALALGRQLYAERPRSFAERIAAAVRPESDTAPRMPSRRS
jgi:CHAD domain-containing protein